MTRTELRVECLKLAVNSAIDFPQSTILNRAEEYEKWICQPSRPPSIVDLIIKKFVAA